MTKDGRGMTLGASLTKFLGVLGGMGPLATANFLRKLVEYSTAQSDQGHLPVIVYGDCSTPDRTAHVTSGGPSPLPRMVAGVRFLDDAGVGAICIPCNSAHCWYAELSAVTTRPILHIVEAVVSQLRRVAPEARRVGVLSTRSTYRMRLYDPMLAEAGYVVVAPSDDEFDDLISPGIGLVKANLVAAAGPLLERAADRLLSRGAEVVVLACTEIPLGLSDRCRRDERVLVDSGAALARAAVEWMTQRGG